MQYDRRTIENEKKTFEDQPEIDTETIKEHLRKTITIKRGWLYLLMIATLLLGMYIG